MGVEDCRDSCRQGKEGRGRGSDDALGTRETTSLSLTHTHTTFSVARKVHDLTFAILLCVPMDNLLLSCFFVQLYVSNTLHLMILSLQSPFPSGKETKKKKTRCEGLRGIKSGIEILAGWQKERSEKGLARGDTTNGRDHTSGQKDRTEKSRERGQGVFLIYLQRNENTGQGHSKLT